MMHSWFKTIKARLFGPKTEDNWCAPWESIAPGQIREFTNAGYARDLGRYITIIERMGALGPGGYTWKVLTKNGTERLGFNSLNTTKLVETKVGDE